jgi:hypothetical protein
MVLISLVGPLLDMSESSLDESDDGIIDPSVFTMDDYIGLQNNINNIVTQIATNIQATMGLRLQGANRPPRGT